MRQSRPVNLFFVLLAALTLSSPAFADDPPSANQNKDHGTAGGAEGGLRFDGSGQSIEDALRSGGFIQGGNSGSGVQAGTTTGTGGTGVRRGSGSSTPSAQPTTQTENLYGGGTRTVTTHPDGSRSVEYKGRSAEPTDMSTTFDKDGHVTSETSRHSNGTTTSMTYNPETGVRENVSHTPLEEGGTGTTRMVSQRDGGSVTTQTGYNENTVTTTEDAEGHVTRTTKRPDGTKSEETYTSRPSEDPYATSGDPRTRTTTEYGADGKPDSSVTVTTERWGRGYRQTRREVTQYDDRGKPVKTEIFVPGRWFPWVVVEEVTYWHNGYRKQIVRRDPNQSDWIDGRNVQRPLEFYYYDHLGNLERSSTAPGHTAGDPPTSGTWYVPRNRQNQQSSAATTGSQDNMFARLDGLGFRSSRAGVNARDLVDRPVVHQVNHNDGFRGHHD